MKKRIILAAFMVCSIAFSLFSALPKEEQNVNINQDIDVTVNENVPERTSAVSQENTEAVSSEGNQQKAEETTRKQQEKNNNELVPTGYSIEDLDDDAVISSDQGKKEENKKPETITAVVSVNCENAVAYGANVPEYFFQNEPYKAEKGATAFDALKALCDENGISLNYQRKTYIQGIGGLNEKDCGGASGWIYLVNGVKPSKPASSYVLENGDVVEWRYVTNSNQ